MTNEDAKLIMTIRNYIFSYEIRNGEGKTTSLVFSYIEDPEQNKRFPIPTYNVIVYPETEEFEFSYHSKNSINQLSTPKCGSITNDVHFDRIAMKFEHDAAILAKYNM